MQSNGPIDPSKRRTLARVAAVALGVTALAGCMGEQALDDAGATLSGRIRLAPLREAPPAGQPTVQFLPISGTPVTIADAIYRGIRNNAAQSGILLVHRLEEPATWRVQGHLVALGHSTASTIIFTWDVYDVHGNPVHRITGQEVAIGVEGDPWGAVDAAVQTRLAARAVRGLQNWLNRS
jgi:hypothetical protein